MNRKSIIIPFSIVTDNNLSSTTKVIYAVLKTFQKGKSKTDLVSSVTVKHLEIMQRSNHQDTLSLKH